MEGGGGGGGERQTQNLNSARTVLNKVGHGGVGGGGGRQTQKPDQTGYQLAGVILDEPSDETQREAGLPFSHIRASLLFP